MADLSSFFETEIKKENDSVIKTESLESLKEQYTQTPAQTESPVVPQKRKYTKRTTKEVVPETPAGMQLFTDKESLRRIVVGFGNMVCRRMPDPLPITDWETDLLTDTSHAMIQKYLPSATESLTEYAFFAALAVLYIARKDKPVAEPTQPVQQTSTPQHNV